MTKTLKHLVSGETIGTYTEDCKCENQYCEHLISDFDKFCNMTHNKNCEMYDVNFDPEKKCTCPQPEDTWSEKHHIRGDSKNGKCICEEYPEKEVREQIKDFVFTKEEYIAMKSIALSRGWIIEIDGLFYGRLGRVGGTKENSLIEDLDRYILSRLIMMGGFIEKWEYKFLPERNEYLIIY